jgi:hypothetical protein
MENNIVPSPEFIPPEFIERRIYLIRGRKVMIDADLAELYQVPTSRLNQAVKRNAGRFPYDFMFQLNKNELENWISQIVISNSKVKMGVRKAPYAFTEHGVAMLSSVLNSKRAIQMNILIIRVFMKMRELLAGNKEIAERIEKLEANSKRHASVLVILINDILKLTNPSLEPPEPKEPIGFRVNK